jgi:hypothetical protein
MATHRAYHYIKFVFDLNQRLAVSAPSAMLCYNISKGTTLLAPAESIINQS